MLSPTDSDRIRLLAKHNLLSQEQLAKAFGVSQSTISRLLQPPEWAKERMAAYIERTTQAHEEAT